ncbi:twin-arginine translocase subunit TatC [Oryzibacter oryziterrae]|uniref:twin-arginine translocase subunit TatC n=1 Tax=Oryzibacter oryziterrae TaxID=2766474 RepID=UPI001F02EFD8|nr:twin-arginine translocase subunit TatC [Oryzibacter oryziterrae]
MSADDDEIEASKAPLIEHLKELRSRLLKSILALLVCFLVCFYFANDIFNILVVPFERAAGADQHVQLIYTAPQEYFFTQLRLALFGAFFIAFPVIATQIYMFVAPGLYKHERQAFLPYLVATPVLFLCGALLVYFAVMPGILHFFMAMQQAGGNGKAEISLLPKVSEYLSLIETLIFAFGIVFQLPVVLTLVARIGLIDENDLKRWRRYAILLSFVAAAILTPPDPLSQIMLAVPTMLLYEVSIVAVRFMKKRSESRDVATTED